MGRSGSSSKRKHSKKKNLKVSSEVRRKKKIRKNKSKKLRHHDDSFSDDESTSSSVFSSSSSEGEYRSKKSRSRSRARDDVKSSKKRTRKRSLSEDSGKDSSPVKKRKGSRKKNKKIKKKKSKRYDYISSSNSDSASCSTGSSDDMASHVRSRGRSREKKKDHRYLTKGKIGNKKNRSRSMSMSMSRSASPSNSYDSTYDDENIENVTVETNPRRLKSVITVAHQDTEEQDDMKKDELKEEIVYDYDDYPSCKSNDSNELVDRFNVSPEKRKISTSVISEVNSAFSLDDSKEKQSNISGNIGSEVDDLELKLRQKALENLSKFRKTKTVVNVDEKNKNDQSDVKQMTSASVDLGQTESRPVSQPVIPRSRFTWRRDSSVTTGKEETPATYGGPQSSGSQPVVPKNKIVNETLEIKADTNDSSGGTGTNVDQKSTPDLETPSSAASTKPGSSNQKQNETNDNSQFEKKTMTVMRGGEMVQVSYKVYIPNKAPALARRQLKR